MNDILIEINNLIEENKKILKEANDVNEKLIKKINEQNQIINQYKSYNS